MYDIYSKIKLGRNKIYDDFLNTEKIQRPPAIIIVPHDVTKQNFTIDIRYADFTATLDVPVGYTNAECYIVPPYKPLLYVGVQPGADTYVSVYAVRGTK